MGAPTFLDLAAAIDRVLHRNINFPFRSVSTSPVSILDTDLYIAISAAGGNRVLTLPDAAVVGAGMGFKLIRTDSTLANTVTIGTTGGQTINGAASVGITKQYSALEIVSDGANWLLYASPDAFALQSDVLWIFPNTLSTDQNAGLYTYYAAIATSFAAFDVNLNVAPSGQSVLIDWKVNGIVNPALQVEVPAGSTYAEVVVAVALSPGDTLQPVVSQVGAPATGQTATIRARGT